ncbi:HD domain-containing protein [Candidatus Woesearchaeota archaeon]|nr:HD domain-containing protein [Candidatus Woesearchaeota archaeon]
MDDFHRLMKLMELKDVKRYGTYPVFIDSTADHVYGLMAFAEYFFQKVSCLDRYKVMKIILYHDLVEIETGDVVFDDKKGRETKEEEESVAIALLSDKIPVSLKSDFLEIAKEYNDASSREAQFVKAIDKIEPMIHCARLDKDWKKYGWDEQFLRNYKDKYIKPFPELMEFWNQLLEELKKQEYI